MDSLVSMVVYRVAGLNTFHTPEVYMILTENTPIENLSKAEHIPFRPRANSIVDAMSAWPSMDFFWLRLV